MVKLESFDFFIVMYEGKIQTHTHTHKYTDYKSCRKRPVSSAFHE